MRNLSSTFLYFLTALLIGWYPCCGQSADNRTTPAQQDMDSFLRARYQHQVVPAYSLLINGPEYLDYRNQYIRAQGHQFYQFAELQPGTITYDGTQFENIPLLYDIHRDQLVVQHPASSMYVRLITSKVNYFLIGDKRFIYLLPGAENALPAGFYNVLYEGATNVLVKKSKRARESVARDGKEIEFTETSKMFLVRNSQYKRINNKRAVLAFFTEDRKLLQRYITSSKLRFTKASFEQDVVAVVQYQAEKQTPAPASPAAK